MSEKFTAAVVISVSLLFLIPAVILGGSLWLFIQDAEFSQGKVEDLYSNKKGLQAPKVSFTAKNNKDYIFQSNSYADDRYNIGDPVKVLYTPNNPNNAAVYNFIDMWGTSFTFSVIGLPLFLIGILMLVKALFGTRRRVERKFAGTLGEFK